MSGSVDLLRAVTLTAHENVMRRSLCLFPPLFSLFPSMLLCAPLPRDQLQTLMKRQSGN